MKYVDLKTKFILPPYGDPQENQYLKLSINLLEKLIEIKEVIDSSFEKKENKVKLFLVTQNELIIAECSVDEAKCNIKKYMNSKINGMEFSYHKAECNIKIHYSDSETVEIDGCKPEGFSNEERDVFHKTIFNLTKKYVSKSRR